MILLIYNLVAKVASNFTDSFTFSKTKTREATSLCH